MKKAHRSSRILVVAVLGVGTAAVFAGCGGGGGGGGGSDTSTPADLTASDAPQVAGAALQAAGLVGPAATLGGIGGLEISSASLEPLSKDPVSRIMDKMMAASRFDRPQVELRPQGRLSRTTESCSDGGTVTVSATWVGPDEPDEPSEVVDLQATITFNSCEEGTETLHGTASVTFSGPSDDPTSVSLSTSSLAYVDTWTGDSVTLTGFEMHITDLAYSGGAIMGGVITVSGVVFGSVDADPISQEYDGFRIVFSSGVTGDTVSMSGRVKASCFGGWVDVTTSTAIFVSSGADCPSDGRISIASGGDSVEVVIESDGSIGVFFNGGLVQTYGDCEEVDGLCVG